MNQYRVADEHDPEEILDRIPNNPDTMLFRHWVTGDLDSEHLGIDDCVAAMLWADHGVAIGATEQDGTPSWTYYVDHNVDLRAWFPGTEIRGPREAAEKLAEDLAADEIDVMAVVTEEQPAPVGSIGKEIVGDGGKIGVECDVDGCDERIVGLHDGWEYPRGDVCQECIEYRDRHGHWPDEEREICVQCRVDDGAINHDCDESAADGVVIEPGNECPYCDFEAAIADGGRLPREQIGHGGFQPASRATLGRNRTPPKCPERSQEYREVQRRTLSNVRTQNEFHNVSTDQEVVVIDGEVRLRISAVCACGWSDTKTLGEVDDE